MKLNAKTEVIELPKEKIGARQAERLFAKAVNESGAYLAYLRQAKNAYVDCCFDFYTARFGFERGAWGAQCEMFKEQISERTIQRRIEDAEIMIVYAQEKFEDLKTIDAIREKYKELPLPAVRAMVQDMRDCGIARKFGEYYAEDYQQKKKAKLLSDGQFQFDFSVVFDGLQRLCSPKAELPDDMEKLKELLGTLESATIRAKKKLKEVANTLEA